MTAGRALALAGLAVVLTATAAVLTMRFMNGQTDVARVVVQLLLLSASATWAATAVAVDRLGRGQVR